MFEVTGEKTNNICCLIDALKAVPSTSIESERVLSAAGISAHSIDHLFF